MPDNGRAESYICDYCQQSRPAEGRWYASSKREEIDPRWYGGPKVCSVCYDKQENYRRDRERKAQEHRDELQRRKLNR